MITSTQCFEAHCDECGEGYGGFYGEEDQTVHYSDRAALQKSLARSEWSLTGERLLCPQCVRVAACALVGHHWEEDWEQVDLTEYRGRRRECEHCSTAEYDPPVRPADR